MESLENWKNLDEIYQKNWVMVKGKIKNFVKNNRRKTPVYARRIQVLWRVLSSEREYNIRQPDKRSNGPFLSRREESRDKGCNSRGAMKANFSLNHSRIN